LEKEEIDKRILEAAGKWKTPFKPGSEQAARERLMSMAQQDSPKQSNGAIWMRIAASITLLAIIPVVLLFIGNTQVVNEGPEVLSHKFPCSSEIQLNPGAKIQYNKYLWTLRRRVHFEGQAYFNVKEGSKFIVDGESGDVEVLGTEFTVWADNNDLFAHCSSGQVKVWSDLEKEILNPGQFTVVSGSRLDPVQEWQRSGFISPNVSGQELIFEETPIGVAITELEISLGFEIEHSLDPTLKYSGRLQTSNPDHCLTVFCKTFNANFVKEEGFVSIHP
jgi:ferric-dicitrate binding protein FerR (iron transport regulator)